MEEELDITNVPAETPLSPMEAIQRRHRREKKELQGKIVNLKKNCSKDKKKKKELGEVIAKMEKELEERHKEELNSFVDQTDIAAVQTGPNDNDEKTKQEHDGLNELSNESVADVSFDSVASTPTPGTPRMSKARKRREKKEAEARERSKRIEQETKELEDSSARKQEEDLLRKLLEGLNLKVADVDSDGHCLYRAISHQLERAGETVNYLELRSRTAQYLRTHKEEFINFMDDETIENAGGYENYCDDVETTAAWGGQVEVKVISNILQRPIKVIQAEGSLITIGEHYKESPLVVTYHRHKYLLGAHYDSAIPISSS